MQKESLLGKNLVELQAVAQQLHLQRFVGKQLCDWLYKKKCTSIDAMTNLSKKVREQLNEKYVVGCSLPQSMQESTDGTKKYLFATGENRYVEAVFIPDKERATLCLSTQMGCKMNCSFCMTGKQGFQNNLTAGEIVNQIIHLPESNRISNIVYMGMGEPFDNLDHVLRSLEIVTSEWGLAMSPRRITVSSIGIIPAMKTFVEKSDCHLAISMHSPFHEEREKMMPVEKVYPIADVIAVLRDYDLGLQRRITFEYILFKDVNDSETHVKAVAKLLKGMRCRVNLIRFHEIPKIEFKGVDPLAAARFRDSLNEKGVLATVRASRGEDILAACGLLSTKEFVK
ncbi:MAG: 23S rRNA (adenine(2503)-C(2))-methyltransferase RlmN [Lentimicrobiaceae bacterium]|jgi:23S rRNA (adenine2503-C2)-methyltransferase|nr:23S rRNA (adenine(2503)-C(2))-methyltransferase RlmN [Lentimicrobiaceae bacterium]